MLIKGSLVLVCDCLIAGDAAHTGRLTMDIPGKLKLGKSLEALQGPIIYRKKPAHLHYRRGTIDCGMIPCATD